MGSIRSTFSSCRSRRDCGHREAVRKSYRGQNTHYAAVAATAAIVRRTVSNTARWEPSCRSRRDCGHREADFRWSAPIKLPEP